MSPHDGKRLPYDDDLTIRRGGCQAIERWLTCGVGEEFEDRDLSDSVFWGVNLQRTLFRDADLSGARFFHTRWSNVSVDGLVDGLVVNGVDVTDFVNANDRWYPLRTQLEPSTAVELQHTWARLCDEWSSVIERAAVIGAGTETRSVNGEWSLRDTLRHLVFAMDKWFCWPILGERSFASIGLPNAGSQALDWPGLERDADPGYDDVQTVRRQYVDRFTDYIADVDLGSLPATVEVIENGPVPAVMCFHVVLEEEFEHLRYILRDLDAIGAGMA